MPSKHLPRREKQVADRKGELQNYEAEIENDQNYKKVSTPVVGKKPNGKS